MAGLTRQLLEVLTLVGALCGLALFFFAAVGFLLAVFRVGVRGRVLVLPFRGTDERRVELSALFARRLIKIEGDWVTLAREIGEQKDRFDKQNKKPNPLAVTEDVEPSEAADSDGRLPITGATITDVLTRIAETPVEAKDIVAGPRSTGDEFVRDILLLEEASSLADADLGIVNVGGVSFSPQEILALLRRLPAFCARRTLSGTVVNLDATSVVTVTFEERSLRGRGGRARSSSEVKADEWLPAIDELAFQLAKGRVDLLRSKPARKSGSREPSLSTGSVTADRAAVEAESWLACEAFLSGYASQLRHYVSGSASDRDQALACYERAIAQQPGYTRALYNSATLLYNRYLPTANKEAISRFEQASVSNDPRVRALAFAGLAMSRCQAIFRFNGDAESFALRAMQASEDALSLEPKLEESRFASAWAYHARGDWDEALGKYDYTVALKSDSAPGRRIQSFARNNQGWIWLYKLSRRKNALARAEQLFCDALNHYPNKVAYSNLAEIARQRKDYDHALKLFGHALMLDREYVNAWNEQALLEVEIAASIGDRRDRSEHLERAAAHHDRAIRLAGDDAYANHLTKTHQAKLKRCSRGLRAIAS